MSGESRPSLAGDGTIYPTIKYGEPRYAYAVFAGVPMNIKRIAQLKCTFNFAPPGAFNHFMDFQFNDIPITPMPKVTSAPAPQKTH